MGQTAPGSRLRAARLARGWTLEDVAVALHQLEAELGEPESRVDLNQVSKWERGARTPGPRYRARLCLVFDAMPRQIGFEETPRLMRDIGELRERQRPAAGRGPGVDDRLAATLRNLWPADGPLVDQLERRLRDLSSMTDSGTARDVLADLRDYLDTVLELLTARAQPAAVTGRLLELGSTAAQHAGFLEDAAGRIRQAYALSAEAERMARESGHGNRLAGVFIDRAEQLSRRAHGPEDLGRAIEHGEAARLTMDDSAPSGLSGWVLGQLSTDVAAQGDDVRSGRYLDAAYRVTAGRQDVNIFSDYESMWLESYRGRRALSLGSAAEAQAVFEAVLQGTDPRLTWEHTRALYRLGHALALQGEPERAAGVLAKAVAGAIRWGDRRALGAVTTVRTRHLSRWHSQPAVRELDEAIRAAR